MRKPLRGGFEDGNTHSGPDSCPPQPPLGEALAS